jgi:hypothetical protein
VFPKPEGCIAMLPNQPGFRTEEHGPSPMLADEAPGRSFIAEPDPAELRKYIAAWEARLARTWHQIAAPATKPSPANPRLGFPGIGSAFNLLRQG